MNAIIKWALQNRLIIVAVAVMMANEVLTKAEKPEIKTPANQIIKEQDAEIKMMNDMESKVGEITSREYCSWERGQAVRAPSFNDV